MRTYSLVRYHMPTTGEVGGCLLSEVDFPIKCDILKQSKNQKQKKGNVSALKIQHENKYAYTEFRILRKTGQIWLQFYKSGTRYINLAKVVAKEKKNTSVNPEYDWIFTVQPCLPLHVCICSLVWACTVCICLKT